MDTTHDITINAEHHEVFALLARAERWPELFEPTIQVTHVDRRETTETFRIWARAGDQVKTWISVRELDPGASRITFRQTVPAPPIASMSGTWIVERVGPGQTTLRLLHTFSAVGDDPEALAWIERVTDENSRTELANIKAVAEREKGEVRIFTDSVRIAAAADAVHAFLWQAEHWTDRLPHVGAVRLDNFGTTDIQSLRMTTLSSVGVHETMSIRITDGTTRIGYKQLDLPPLLDLHLGSWTVRAGQGETLLTSEHVIRLRPEVAGENLDKARNALSANSMATMLIAKSLLEGA
ncbi:MAG TPA: SRPBCC family protein [Actinophytocola sp.]|uniref:aromatase/cyclase n=1 Tax=Actinophytocola sp. TaxID=1872138 RepID=UPI002DB6A4B7|nr:SRPBCC family protein [Actinophytocola sp.]HEU5473630.1 SRPBCC family protein [Actinophytocola sp.]